MTSKENNLNKITKLYFDFQFWKTMKTLHSVLYKLQYVSKKMEIFFNIEIQPESSKLSDQDKLVPLHLL